VVTVSTVPLLSEMFPDHYRMVAAVTDLAKIPKAKHEAFCDGINLLCEALDEFAYYPKNTDAEVIAAAQVVRAANNAVLALSPSQLKQLASAAWFVRPPVGLTSLKGGTLPGAADPALGEPMTVWPDHL
jgi:hypothetical protein